MRQAALLVEAGKPSDHHQWWALISKCRVLLWRCMGYMSLVSSLISLDVLRLVWHGLSTSFFGSHQVAWPVPVYFPSVCQSIPSSLQNGTNEWPAHCITILAFGWRKIFQDIYIWKYFSTKHTAILITTCSNFRKNVKYHWIYFKQEIMLHPKVKNVTQQAKYCQFCLSSNASWRSCSLLVCDLLVWCNPCFTLLWQEKALRDSCLSC